MLNSKMLESMRNVIASWEVEPYSFHDSGFNRGIRKVTAYLDTILNLGAAITTDPRDEQIRMLRDALEPFAKAAKQFENRICYPSDSAGVGNSVTLGDLRRALAATHSTVDPRDEQIRVLRETLEFYANSRQYFVEEVRDAHNGHLIGYEYGIVVLDKGMRANEALAAVQPTASVEGGQPTNVEQQNHYAEMRRNMGRVFTDALMGKIVPEQPTTEPQQDDDRIYPCAECGTMRTKSEGGTTFTVCDSCWDKARKQNAEQEVGE